jgi:hypothetical protein
VNVPRVDYDDSRVAGLRDHLADKCAELLARFVESDAEHFPYRGAEIRRLQSRLDDLHGNRDVLVYQHEIPAEWQPPRDEDGRIVFTLTGDRLVPAQFERVRPKWDTLPST